MIADHLELKFEFLLNLEYLDSYQMSDSSNIEIDSHNIHAQIQKHAT